MGKDQDKTEKQILLEMSGKLSAVIQLQAAFLIKDKNIRDSIKILDSAGIGATQIANLLGKKPTFVSKELALIRKKK